VKIVLMSSPPRPSRVVIGLLAVAASVLTACTASSSGGPATTTSAEDVISGSGNAGLPSTTPAAPTSAPASTSVQPTKPTLPKTDVHISLINSDGATYGVGMPVIAYFTHKIKSAKSLQDATTLTVNGRKANGAWYFETSAAGHGPIEAHFRMQNYWPAHAHIHIGIPAKGLTAGVMHGHELTYDDSLTLDFSTGAAHIATVDDATHTMTVMSDGKKYGTFPVSLGADDPDTRTYTGTKVIMEKVPTVCMQDLRGTYHDCGIKYDQRVTYSGEYLHSAPWNCTGSPGCYGPANNIGSADSSNGCTNLRPDDAKQLYHFLRVGDVVNYPDANGPAMSLGAGYGDWNVDWGQWQTGGLVSTT
jgi:lipoprotein-anchoring transpeptidase ErfK/SrfK